jgi:sortase A
MIEVAAAALIFVVGTALALAGPRALGSSRDDTSSSSPAPAVGAPRHLGASALGADTGGRPAPSDPFSMLVDVLRRRPWLRRGLSILSIALLLGAVGMIGYPFYTNLVQSRLQSKLDRQLASPDLREAYLNREIGIGDSLTRIQIPKIDVDVVVVEGTTASALRAGAGHYPDTPLPCEAGNVAIAGHRTTYGRPFHNVDLLEPGDEIILQTPIGECTYEVAKAPFPVAPSDYHVVANTPDAANLTLTTCHPKGSARQRLVVQARMVSSTTEDA